MSYGWGRNVGVPCVLPTANSSKFPSLSSSIVRTKAAPSLECNLLKRKRGAGGGGPPGNAGWLGWGLQERKGNEGAGNCRIMRLIKNKNKGKKG